ncbi:MAG: hypothetical protein NVS1B7_2530 [Candidatus Saccharimonadales bacterium]
MVHPNIVQKQLRQIGADFRHWGRGEAREIPQALMEGEALQVALMGRYSGGFAMLIATDQRILLIDKKPLYLTIEDIRYDMVAEVDYRHQLIDATVHICTLNKQLRFTSTRKPELRQLTNFIQVRVSELRQHQQVMNNMMQSPQTAGVSPYNKSPLIMRRRVSPYSSLRP